MGVSIFCCWRKPNTYATYHKCFLWILASFLQINVLIHRQEGSECGVTSKSTTPTGSSLWRRLVCFRLEDPLSTVMLSHVQRVGPTLTGSYDWISVWVIWNTAQPRMLKLEPFPMHLQQQCWACWLFVVQWLWLNQALRHIPPYPKAFPSWARRVALT